MRIREFTESKPLYQCLLELRSDAAPSQQLLTPTLAKIPQALATYGSKAYTPNALQAPQRLSHLLTAKDVATASLVADGEGL